MQEVIIAFDFKKEYKEFYMPKNKPGILVVEDDENLNRGITFSLKKSGYEVFSAESVKKAKRIASDNNVDVTICDVNLPDGNGLEFVRWMRCNYNTYIICLTALD